MSVNINSHWFRFGERFPDLKAPFVAADVAAAELELLHELESAYPAAIVRIDFDGIRIASGAVRALLRRPVRRIVGGDLAELSGRYLVLENVGDSWDSVAVTLRDEGIAMVAYCKKGDEPEVLGKTDAALTETYRFVRASGEATAKAVMDTFRLNTIAAASNRLATLAKHALVHRVDDKRAGMRQYVYHAIS